jgi:hypothetical protein
VQDQYRSMGYRRKECSKQRNAGKNCKDLPTAARHEKEYAPEAGTGQQELLITKVRAQNCALVRAFRYSGRVVPAQRVGISVRIRGRA